MSVESGLRTVTRFNENARQTPVQRLLATLAIGRVTFSEILRDKVLYNVLVCAVILFSVGLLAARLTFTHPERVVNDMGQAAVALSSAMLAIFLGAGLIGQEIHRRTIHLALSHPVSRGQFVLGKFAGLAGVLILNWVLLAIAYSVILGWMGGDWGLPFSATLLTGLLFSLLQSLLLAAIAIFFSSFSTTSLSAILCVGIYLIGHSVSELGGFVARLESPAARGAGKALVLLLPDLEHFSLGFKLTYGLPLSGALVGGTLAYWALWTAVCLAASGLVMGAREI